MIDRDKVLDTMADAMTIHLDNVRRNDGTVDLLTEPGEWHIDGWVPKRLAMDAVLTAAAIELCRQGLISINDSARIAGRHPLSTDFDLIGPADTKQPIIVAPDKAAPEPTEQRIEWQRSAHSDMTYFLVIIAPEPATRLAALTGMHIDQVEASWILTDDTAGQIDEFPFTDRESRDAALRIAMEQGRKFYLDAPGDQPADTPAPARRFLDFWLQRSITPTVIEIGGKRQAIVPDPLFNLAEAISEYLEGAGK